MHILSLVMAVLSCLLAGTLACAAVDPMTRASVPADGRVTITDYGYREWVPELVQYRIDTNRFGPGSLVLLDGEGQAVPFQIKDGILAFAATVPKGTSVTYRLQASATDRSAEGTTLTSAVQEDTLEVHNEHLTLRMPAPGEKTYDAPVDAALLHQVPGGEAQRLRDPGTGIRHQDQEGQVSPPRGAVGDDLGQQALQFFLSQGVLAGGAGHV